MRGTTGKAKTEARRPKGTKSSKPTLPEERLKDIVLAEADRTIPAYEGGRIVTLTMAQAIIHRLAFDAAKGQSRARQLFIKMLSMIEKERYDEWLKTEHAGQGTVIQVVFSDDRGERDDESGEGED